MKRTLFILICLLLTGIPALPQDDKKAQKETRKKERAGIEQVFRAYLVCSFDGGLKISEFDRIQKDKVKYLARPTAKNVTDKSIIAGKSEDRAFIREDGVLYEGVTRTDGYRVMFDFGQPEYFANLRVDRSQPEGYSEDKEILLRWIRFLHKERSFTETESVQDAEYNGFKVYSTNRNTIERNEPGITLFFDDENKIYVTIYFLYQRRPFRRYASFEEWKDLRDKFLKTYTGCVRENLKNAQTNEAKGSGG